jgi:hypothetical protein
LEDFFSRPIRIKTYDWGVGTNLFDRFDPWSLFFNDQRVVNRIANYKLMRAKLCVKFVINGTGFHFGRLLASYTPLRTSDTMTVDRAFVDADLVGASQKPHVYIDPTNSQGGEMCLPFFLNTNLIDITSNTWDRLGEIAIHSIQQLKHANGATDTINISVFAWAEDVKFAVPTAFDPGTIAPQADEYGEKPVSRIASAVANIAARMTDVPVIGPYARATEIGAKAMGMMASLFGYSAPLMLESSVYKPVNAGNFAVCNMPSDAHKLTVDAKQELCVDSRTVGLDGTDELTIKHIASRESYLVPFPWLIGTPKDSLLFNMVVDPCLHVLFGNEIHLPACAFAAAPFRYWRGTMKFRFQFVCSKYHKGRVRIVYDPTGTAAVTSSEFNTTYQTVVDISDTTDFTMEVGWGQNTSFRKRLQIPSTIGQMYGSTAINPASGQRSNGTLSVYVLNELAVPNSVAQNDIEVNVSISMGDDFEVAGPDFGDVQRLRLRDPDNVISPQAIEPHAGEVEESTEESKPTKPEVVRTVANEIPTTDPTNLVHFGERITSFRQLLKRYCLHDSTGTIRTGTSGTDRRHLIHFRSAFPFYPGVTDGIVGGGYVVNVNAGANLYIYGRNTWLNYVTPAFAGWRGSVRWMVDTSTYAEGADGGVARVSVQPDSVGHLITDSARPSLQSNTGRADANNYDAGVFQNGGLVQNIKTNPLLSFEVPYYKEFRFSPARFLEFPGFGDFNQNGWTLELEHVDFSGFDTARIDCYCAAGEDFSPFFFLGAPIMYNESIIDT